MLNAVELRRIKIHRLTAARASVHGPNIPSTGHSFGPRAAVSVFGLHRREGARWFGRIELIVNESC